MSGIEKLNGLADMVRTMSGTVGKLSVDSMASIASSAGQWGVRVPNLVSKDVQSGQSKFSATRTTDLFNFYNVYEQQTYSASIFIKNVPADMHLRLYVWDNKWNYASFNDGKPMLKGNSGKLTARVTAPKGMLGPGIIRCSLLLEQEPKENMTIDYKNLMLNEGDYAPYTSSTTAYTVDSLAERLTALENKVGGVRKPALSAFLYPLKGGVAYVA